MASRLQYLQTSIMFIYYFAFMLSCICKKGDVKKTYYIAVERPKVLYANPKLYGKVFVTSRRYTRGRDPVYYVSMSLDILQPIQSRTLSADLYFFELLSNTYKRSFVEMHFDDICEFFEKDDLIGSVLVKFYNKTPNQFYNSAKCPYPAGSYNLENITIPPHPGYANFPFTHGRTFFNVTSIKKEPMLSVSSDITIKLYTYKDKN